MDTRRIFEIRNTAIPKHLHPQGKISLLQWNLLSDQLSNPESFPRVSASNLQWVNRFPRIVEYICEANADIVTLQECDHPEEIFEAVKHIYSGYEWHKKQTLNDGLMIMWKRRFHLKGKVIQKY